jgi:hypothetical protein
MSHKSGFAFDEVAAIISKKKKKKKKIELSFFTYNFSNVISF